MLQHYYNAATDPNVWLDSPATQNDSVLYLKKYF
jgi:hypothetical protein